MYVPLSYLKVLKVIFALASHTHTHTHMYTQMDLFVVGDLSSALTADSLNESHPILQNVSSPNEINSLFDSISYSKVCLPVLHVERFRCDEVKIEESDEDRQFPGIKFRTPGLRIGLVRAGGCLVVVAQWQSTGAQPRCPEFDSWCLLAFYFPQQH